MLCPFCAEEVKDEAIVCKHCTRDIAIPKPLIQKNVELEKQNEELTSKVQRLERQLRRYEGDDAPLAPLKAPGFGMKLAAYIGVLVGLVAVLLLAHYFMVIRFDVKTIYLRIVSMLIPLPFGFALFWKLRGTILAPVIIGAIAGFVAVMGMLAVVGYIDNVPIIPRDKQEWQEALEYSLSILLATVTGYMLARIAVRYMSTQQKSSGILNAVAREIASFMGPAGSEKKLTERIASIEQLLNSVVTVATTLGSIFAGVKGVLN